MNLFLPVLGVICLFFTASDAKTVPQIDKCAYVDAYAVECFWHVAKGVNSSVYRLLYLRQAEPHHVRAEQVCGPTTRHGFAGDDQSFTESCTVVGATPYARFTFTLSVLCDKCEDESCVCGRGSSLHFECDPEKVSLQSPPAELKFDKTYERLSWSPPKKERSMLYYVFTMSKLEYKLEYLHVSNTSRFSWKVMYIRNHTHVYLEDLIPGESYTAKVYARLISPDNSSKQNGWSRPATIEFQGTPLNDFAEKGVMATSTAPTVIASRDRRSVIIASCVGLLTVVCLVVITYKLVYKRMIFIKKLRRTSSAIIMVEMDDLLPVHTQFPHEKESLNESEAWQQLSVFSKPGCVRHKLLPASDCQQLYAAASQIDRSNNNPLPCLNVRCVRADIHRAENDSLGSSSVTCDEGRSSQAGGFAISTPHHRDREARSSNSRASSMDNNISATSSCFRDALLSDRSEARDGSVTSSMEENSGDRRSDLAYVTSAASVETWDLEREHQEARDKQASPVKYSHSPECKKRCMLPDYVTQVAGIGEREWNLFVALNCEPLPRRPFEETCTSGQQQHANRHGLEKVFSSKNEDAVCSVCKTKYARLAGDRPSNNCLSVSGLDDSRRNSGSANSVDSGYSPDSPMST